MELSSISIFFAGVLTFFAPCVLPIYPMYLSYITGVSINDLNEGDHKLLAMTHSVFFVLGLSSIFFAVGFAASALGNLFIEYQNLLRYIGGFVMIFMGLHIAGLFNFGFLSKDTRNIRNEKKISYWNSFLVGLSFGAGWTPCISPILASVYALAATYPSKSLIFISLYNIGFALPFIALSYFVSHLKKLNKHMEKIQRINGIIFIVIGILLFTGQLNELSIKLTKFFGDSWF